MADDVHGAPDPEAPHSDPSATSGEPAGSPSKWRLWNRFGLFTVVVVALVLLLAAGIGVEVSGSLSPTGGDSSSTTSTTAAGGSGSTTTTEGGSSGGSTTTTTTLPQNNAPGVPGTAGAYPGHGAYDAVACPLSTRCVAVGVDDTGAGVAATSGDGGNTWVDASLPAATSVPELDTVACADADHCVAGGRGTLLISSDGGNTWAPALLPVADTTVLDVTCASATFCVAVGISPSTAGPYSGQIVYSTDAGQDWTEGSYLHSTLGLGSVACGSPTFCVAVGAAILTSDDGGVTWQPGTVAGGTGALRAVACPTTTECIAVGPNPAGQADSSVPAFGIVTSDGGQTFQPATFPAGAATLDVLSCSGPTQCYAGGPSPTQGTAPLFVTSDGGSTWAATPAPSGVTTIAGLACPSAGQCVLVGKQGTQPVVSVTSAGAPSWATNALPNS
jgi:photosystem II stability/assembly factor-like uncharacterized protein